MKLTEQFPLDGRLVIKKSFPGKEKEVLFAEDNLIVTVSRQRILSWLYTFPAISAIPIRYLKVGTGGTVDPQGVFPKLESPVWTDLNIPVTSVGALGYILASLSIDAVTPSVTFLVDLDQATANGLLITEAGLFYSDQVMFNIKTFPGIPKSSEFSLHFEWTVKFA